MLDALLKIFGLLEKIVIGICLALATWWVTLSGQLFDQSRECMAMQVSLLDSWNRDGPRINRDQLDYKVALIPKQCAFDRPGFTRLLTSGKVVNDDPKGATVLAFGGEVQGVPPTTGGDTLAKRPAGGTDAQQDMDILSGKPAIGDRDIPGPGGVADAPGATKKPADAGAKPPPAIAPERWVALGYVDPRTYSESNFSVGRDDSPVKTPPAANQILQARWNVYVRPGAADWSRTIGLVQQGQCVKVLETKTLGANARQQIWSRVAPAECDS